MYESLAQGVGISLALSLLALAIGFLFAIGMLGCLYTQNPYCVLPVRGLITCVRGVPLIVQIFLLYYGCAEIAWLKSSFFWPLFKHPFFCATVALGLNSSAYTAVLLESNMKTIPQGELEIARVMDLSLYAQLRYILFPRVFTHFWPVYSNEIIMTLKNTSLVSTITLMDLMGATRQIMAITYQPFHALTIACLLYILMSVILVWGIKQGIVSRFS